MEVLNEHLASRALGSGRGGASERNRPPSAGLGQGPSAGGHGPFPEATQAATAGSTSASGRPVASSLAPLPGPSGRPPAAPSGGLAHLLGAGFAPREAVEALRRAGGDTELALRLLLAKGIVVPK